MKSKLLKLGKKLIVFVLLWAVLLPSFTQAAQAFSTPENTHQFQFENAVFKTDEMNLQSFVYETMKSVLASGVVLIFGCFTCEREEAKKIEGPEKSGMPLSSMANYGTVGVLASAISGVYTQKPASGIAYMASLGERLKIVRPAHAQYGKGFRQMDILIPIWRAFRNATYVFFVIILIIMGFAIMFRVKINPQTVISIQNVLPKIIVVLILITFSYAIVGLMIDIMWVINNLIMVSFKEILEETLKDAPDVLVKLIQAPIQTPTTSELGIFSTILIVGLPPILLTFIILFLALLIGIVFASVTVGIGTGVAFGVAAILLFFAIFFLIILVRMLWTLLKAYAMVVLALVFAPFQILLGLIPGTNTISGWFKNLLANLAVLPTVLIMSFLAGYFTIVAAYNFDTRHRLISLLTDLIVAFGDPSPLYEDIITLITNQISDVITLLILFFVSITILFLIPKAADMIKAFITQQPFQFGAAVGETFKPAKVAGLGALQYGATEATERYQKRMAQMQATGGAVTPTTPERAAHAIANLLKRLGTIR